ncbi:hypothetical protein L6Q96_15395 [Candidatus Binatia bacterium]|nr:hypothetical protein [Candidatus Binatia bacterium]
MMSTPTVSRTVGGIAARTTALEVRTATAAERLARAESQQQVGRWMIMAGFVVTILGVVGYCVASFAGGVNAGISDILFANAVPFARTTLIGLGIGTALWLVGSFTYLHGVIIADELTANDAAPAAED